MLTIGFLVDFINLMKFFPIFSFLTVFIDGCCIFSNAFQIRSLVWWGEGTDTLQSQEEHNTHKDIGAGTPWVTTETKETSGLPLVGSEYSTFLLETTELHRPPSFTSLINAFLPFSGLSDLNLTPAWL